MSETYDIYFAGKIVEGFDEGDVRESVARIFKANAATVEKLFSGKPQLIKRGVDRKTAIKYKAALEQAGAVPVIRAGAQPQAASQAESDLPSSASIPGPSAPPSPAPGSTGPESATAAKAPQADTLAERLAALTGKTSPGEPALEAQAAAEASHFSSLSLAPVGSDVLREDERQVFEELDIDTSAIELMDLDESMLQESAPPPPPPDTDHLSMGQVGEDIPHLENSPTPLNPDTSHLSVGEAGEPIPRLESGEAPLDPDTSGIELAPEGSDVLDGKYRKREHAKPPDTDHLSLES